MKLLLAQLPELVAMAARLALVRRDAKCEELTRG